MSKIMFGLFNNRSQKVSAANPVARFAPILIVAGIFVLAVLALTFLIAKTQVLVVVALIVAVFLLVALFYWPEPGTLIVIFAIYTNLAVIAYKFHGLPQILAASISLLLCVPLAVYWFIRREKFVIDYPWLMMICFLGALFASLMVARNLDLALEWIYTFMLEGIGLYIIIINVVRKISTLRAVVWTLLLAGAFLGSITAMQELSKSYRNNYGGFAQRNIARWDGGAPSQKPDKVRLANRSGGPIGDPNRFAQILIVLLPLGLFRIIDEKKGSAKFWALLCTGLILVGTLLTYSRGGFITITLLVTLVTILRYIKFSYVAIAVAGMLTVVAVSSPNYFLRMSSIFNVQALFSNDASVSADGATRGRVTEMLAALNCYLDHPIVGVGPGQYSKFYSIDYMADPSIAFREILSTRRAHTLYFELMAETGTLGLASFMAIVVILLSRLWRLRKRFLKTNTEYANLATGFWLSIVAYLSTAVFLHFSYQRYFWILLALGGATIHVLEALSSDNSDCLESEAVPVEAMRLEKAV